ncbi:MAG: ADP-forming succinate--CoA ligase subunit beta [Bacteroidales bacterium]|nr:ADP-forming succinate--CoA ligase subunit beta [Bacteroidales bacterium]MDD2424672.1 ADP-forming succinate--CoA ligase subunit beta [Bacteroidales bacterium]MDD3989880.1 ADP-forming succinate--CoA ligase subunit beta [Bacteroidales bacterium]MDD4638129.1 ADP-forming succinate--CoA ligase subunit beta [Bacteroidales bacterium]
MKIQEYQAHEIFRKYGIPSVRGIVCESVAESLEAYRKTGSQRVVIKAQVLSGGRGKAGGVALASDSAQVESLAGKILGMKIKELDVKKILVVPAVEIASEYYLSFVIDRSTKSTVMILSSEGGVDIEQVAVNTPEKINKISIFPFVGIPEFLARKAASMLFTDFAHIRAGANIIRKLYKIMVDLDASLVEINPLVITKEGEVIALDAKVNFDENALYRQPEVAALMEPDPQEQKELEAKSHGFSYIHLDGNIGCMVNGAGLAMTTMDLVNLYGGKAANFLDIGGSSNSGKVVQAVKLLLSDSNVKAVLVNIFGGITRCDDVARGLTEAFNGINTDIPVVVRLTGTNETEGHRILEGSRFHIAGTMRDAINMVIELAGKSTRQ